MERPAYIPPHHIYSTGDRVKVLDKDYGWIKGVVSSVNFPYVYVIYDGWQYSHAFDYDTSFMHKIDVLDQLVEDV